MPAARRRSRAAGGTAPCVLNAANEIAVHAFLEGRLRFLEIPDVIERTLPPWQRTGEVVRVAVRGGPAQRARLAGGGRSRALVARLEPRRAAARNLRGSGGGSPATLGR